MLFNSIPFLFLFLFTYIIYWNVNSKNKKTTLLISSLLFYAYFNIYFLFHFILVIFINYIFSERLFKLKNLNLPTNNTLILVILLNFLNLAFFKYFYFFSDMIYSITGIPSIKEFTGAMNIFLPLAISFYTFQIVAIQVDIHRNIIKEKIPLNDYILFIMFFPQLIAGPIMRSAHFLPQINQPIINQELMIKGLYYIIGGLFKKIVIADNISGIITPVLHSPSSYGQGELLITLFAFACQIYNDFSGYTDIAIGTALLLGYHIPENFAGPFLSTSFNEFWTRWHLTLSTWLRDYLYIPLGGNRGGFFRSNLNLFITMCLGGLWHGASLNFLLWGAFLGGLLWLERILNIYIKIDENKLIVKIIKIPIIFTLFSLSGIFFGTASFGKNSWDKSIDYFNGLLNPFVHTKGMNLFRIDELYLFILVTFGFNFLQYYGKPFRLKKSDKFFIPALSLMLLLILGIYGDGGADFVYFQF